MLFSLISLPTPKETACPAISPVEASERLEAIDIIRGFALLGIMIVNFATHHLGGFTSTSVLDKLTALLIQLMLFERIYPLFSLLFGLGMAIQLNRVVSRGVPFTPLYVRRLAVLLALGLLHAILVWRGDILHLYALMGFALLIFCRQTNQVILVAAFICLATPAVFNAFSQHFNLSALQVHATTQDQQISYTSATYGQLLASRADNYVHVRTRPTYYLQHLEILGMFLVGLYAGRQGFSQPYRFQRGSLIVMLSAFALGALGSGWDYLSNHFLAATALPPALSSFTVEFIVKLYAKPAMAVFYGLFALLVLTLFPRVKGLALPLATVGQTALTNYLLQSVIATTLFYSYGAGLYGQLGYAAGSLLAIGIFLLQLVASIWWLNHFRFGPMEWLWRSLTYGTPQPMRRRTIEI